MSNANLQRAKKRKNDEFYTRFEDVEKELAHYPRAFEGKTVYCNCDDPFKSAFVKYFKEHFDKLGLKRLIATCFNSDAGKGETMFLFPRTDDRVAWHFEKTADGETCTPLQYNGDFRSEECVALLRQCDVVVTNPPFSLAKWLVYLTMENSKDFILLAHLKTVLTQTVFPHLKTGKIRVANSFVANFFRPDGSTDDVPVLWTTTLPDDRNVATLSLSQKYDPARFPKYDNYDAINVNRLAEIPCDYGEAIGVPITFLTKYNPDQFEIIGISRAYDKDGSQAQLFDHSFKARKRDNVHLNGEMFYDRIFIKRKNFSCNCSNSLINSPQTERKNISKEKPTNQPKKNPEELDLNYDEP